MTCFRPPQNRLRTATKMPNKTSCPVFVVSRCVRRPSGALAVSGSCVRAPCPGMLCPIAGGTLRAS
eukprot:2816468-Alexandrium_andersonii.AAC.1